MMYQLYSQALYTHHCHTPYHLQIISNTTDFAYLRCDWMEKKVPKYQGTGASCDVIGGLVDEVIDDLPLFCYLYQTTFYMHSWSGLLHKLFN